MDENADHQFVEMMWKRKLLGPEIIQQTMDKIQLIQKRLLATQSRQKSYANNRRELNFQRKDHVFPKVSLTKGVMQFEIRDKLSPRYGGPFEILDRVEEVAYHLALPPALAGVYNVFHVSMLKKYMPDPYHVVRFEPL